MVSVFAIGLKVPGFKPVRSDGYLRTIKICSTASFGGEVKPEAPCKILQHVKITCKYEQKSFATPNPLFNSPVPPSWYLLLTLLVGLPDSCGEKSGVFLCRYNSTMVLDAHISPGVNNRLVGGPVQGRSLTSST
jgi:hypothetical protein